MRDMREPTCVVSGSRTRERSRIKCAECVVRRAKIVPPIQNGVDHFAAVRCDESYKKFETRSLDASRRARTGAITTHAHLSHLDISINDSLTQRRAVIASRYRNPAYVTTGGDDPMTSLSLFSREIRTRAFATLRPQAEKEVKASAKRRRGFVSTMDYTIPVST